MTEKPSDLPVRTAPLLAAERQEYLLSRLQTFGRINAAESALALGTSTETIRKDLIVLEERGLARRVHGGALHLASMTFEPDVSVRHDNLEEKARIATAALAHIPEGGAVLIDAGSTTQAFVDRFPNRRLTVFTSALAIALTLTTRSLVSVSTFGGKVRPNTTAEVGPIALRTLRQMHFDVAFVGANSVSVAHGLATPDPEEAAVKSEMITNSERVILLADHTKFARRSLVRYAEMTDLDLLITGNELEEAHRRELAETKIEVEYA